MPFDSEHALLIRQSGLFDPDYYRGFSVASRDAPDPLAHYLETGWMQGGDPCLYFSSQWYFEQNEDVRLSGINPFVHYLRFGDAEGRNPSPLFDTRWYKEKYRIKDDVNALAHYMSLRDMRFFNPNPYFDARYYSAAHADALEAPADAYAHFLLTGCFQGWNPSAEVDLTPYVQDSGADGRHPFLAYLGSDWSLPRRQADSALVEPAAALSLAAPSQDTGFPVIRNLVDPDYYRACYADVAVEDRDATDHFMDVGLTELRRPNFYLDPEWYRQTYMRDEPENGPDPISHYVERGDTAGFRPGPFFDPQWYRATYQVPAGENCLAHYLKHRRLYTFSPISEFDIDYYVENNLDVKTAGVDAFEHFLATGYKEGRNPSASFQIKYYANKYLGGDMSSNPFIHYLLHKDDGAHHGAPPADEATMAREVRRYTQKSPDFEEAQPIALGKPLKAMMLAYYLPQYHSFEENDAWWGRGFTEWTNIPRGLPRFRGHYQPRVPRDLGYYSLDTTDVVARQIDLARGAGLHGFVYYYYWFNGKRLMAKPLELLLEDKNLDFPFCLMWANENWTRRWDGAESEILISQDYAPEHDARLIDDFARHFADSRYIRLDGRPVLMVYRPGLIPDAAATIARWRRLFEKRHGERPILVMAQSFNDNDPRAFGLDGAIEFPPHKLTANLPSIHPELDYLDDEFSGRVYRYEDLVEVSLDDVRNDFPLIKTAVPSWDNDARRQGTGLVVTGSTPHKYQAWLEQLVSHAQAQPFHGHPIVCINAWNEWCEAAYLEPDLHYGGAYLNATARAALGLVAGTGAFPLLLVGHDAFPSGAQHLLLNIGKRLKALHGITVEFLLLGGGALEDSYRSVAATHIVQEGSDLTATLKSFHDRGFANAVVNSLASAGVLPALSRSGFHAINLVHELPSIIADMNLHSNVQTTLDYAEKVVFAAPYVRDAFFKSADATDDGKAVILPQGCYKLIHRDVDAGLAMREELGIEADASVMIGVGYADLRKGFDLFLQAWRTVAHARSEPVHAIWVGKIDPSLENWLSTELRQAKATGHFHMLGYRNDMQALLNTADIFALTSREDPFPTVVHEALSAGMPIFAFADAGGMSDYLTEHGLGTIVPHGDTHAMAVAINSYLDQPLDEKRRAQLAEFVAKTLNFDPYVSALAALAAPAMPSITVAVPNYNYAHYMEQRLGSIFGQTMPVQEILVLDDCSRDDSLAAISSTAETWEREVQVIVNERNSGSVFAQWRKAAEAASGEFLWIAEADDDTEPHFLETLVWMLQKDEAIQFAFCDSKSIDTEGKEIWPDYKEYYATVEQDALSSDGVYSGVEFIARYMGVKNLILNVSAVLWRRSALIAALNACESGLSAYRLAGDWRLYLEALCAPGAKVAYCADPLNVHRRHSDSVTHGIGNERHINEIRACHRIARTMAGDDARLAEAQDEYIDEVSSQLAGNRTEKVESA